MRIVCKKENDVKMMLALIKRLLEIESIDYPLLKEDLVLEISLQDKEGRSCPKNEESICFDEKDLQKLELDISSLEYYYNSDALTQLYNRGKYERDIKKLQAESAEGVGCVYIDAVGLHEINNHLGHAAGDKMLCSIAAGIRQQFEYSPAYRIGGDEFVIFCFDQEEMAVKQAIVDLKNLLNQEDYQISVGFAMNKNKVPFMKTLECAERAMRYNKMRFYQENGAKRQMRSLNYKLEKILLEKQDASQFLNVIASAYKGVYAVNHDKDTCRYIYIPEYFREILTENHDVFSKSIQIYGDRFVCQEDQARFRMVLNFDYVLSQIKEGHQVGLGYRKKDGNRVYLQIMAYDANSLDSHELLWIFMDGDK